MEKEIGKDSEGKARKEKQEEKENVHLEKILKRMFERDSRDMGIIGKKKPKTTNEDDVEIGPSS